MGKRVRVTTEIFIERANSVHGDRYDYSKVEFTKCRDKVLIVCKEHGEFWQTPAAHMIGQGCFLCAAAENAKHKTKSTQEFIEKANANHNNKYDYSLVDYKHSKQKVKIICPQHGIFEQKPNSHLDGRGCVKCKEEFIADLKRMTTLQFIDKAKSVHGDTYNYDLVNYYQTEVPVTIVCNKHGEFEQTPHAHLSGRGCMLCRNENISIRCRSNTELFISKARKLHGDLFDYSLVDYKTTKDKVDIKCFKHGLFQQTPNAHLVGHGCPICCDENLTYLLRSSKEEFVEKAVKLHGEKYDYSEVEYHTSIVKVIIKCKEHGAFLQRPVSHIVGQGCPSCAKIGFDPLKEGFVYLLDSDDIFKVGITTKPVKERIAKIGRTTNIKFKSVFTRRMGGAVAQEVERRMLRWLKEQHQQPKDKFDGYTECFYKHTNTTIPNIVDKIIEFEKEVFNGN